MASAAPDSRKRSRCGPAAPALSVPSAASSATAPPPITACSPSRICPRRPSGSASPSTSPGISSFAASASRRISGPTARAPARIRSKTVSNSWMKAASSVKPNIAPLPFTVCRSRNTWFTSPISAGRAFRSSRPFSRLSRRSRTSSRKIAAMSSVISPAPSASPPATCPARRASPSSPAPRPRAPGSSAPLRNRSTAPRSGCPCPAGAGAAPG